MKQTGILLQENQLYLSYKALTSLGISRKTVESWGTDVIKEYVEKEAFVLYKSVPSRSRKKLPSEKTLVAEYLESERQNKANQLTKALEQAFYLHHSKYRAIYETDSGLSPEKATRFAQLHAVFQSIIDLKETDGFRDLRMLYEAFNSLYPGKYSSKHALCNAIRKAMAEGIMNVALDKRAFGNNTEQTSKKFTSIQKFWMANLAGHPAKFSNSQILEKICKACEETGQHKPSLSWVKKWRPALLKNPELFSSRYGQQEANKRMPFASLKCASYANDQWQMDGWTLPFWGHRFQRFVLVRLIDNNSKKVVGYSFGETENSTVIMEAIRDAINSTGVIPFEILTDNHAFNQTQEAKNLIQLLAKKGARWTVTQNPQHKAIVERYNQHLDRLCREYWGYLGQGVKSKSPDALAKPEMLEQYSKNFLTKEEIRGIAIEIVEKYNLLPQKEGKTPIQLYSENANPNPIEASIFDRAELLTSQAEKKISRGQITIVRGINKHEFQLPAHLYQKHNGTTVIVHYDDLKDGVYLFEKKTREPIAFLHPKAKINGSIVNQTEEDIEAFHRNKGRIVGIKTKARKELENLSDAAHQIDADAYARINRLTTPKNIVKELEQNGNLRHVAEDKGMQIHLVDGADKVWTTGTTALQPKDRRKDKALTAKNHTIGMVHPQTDLNDD